MTRCVLPYPLLSASCINIPEGCQAQGQEKRGGGVPNAHGLFALCVSSVRKEREEGW